nr:hypothetical protein [Dyella sp. ASV24]
MRIIKVMADYQCFPLWEASPGVVGNIDPEDLPISLKLKSELLEWASKYDQTLDDDYPPDSGFETPAEEEAFKEQGRQLAKKLKHDLGNQFEVKINL